MKPNIILLVMDTARAANFSTYGYERETDPYIKQVAEEGIIFENCYSNSIWTLPSHYSIFTGKLPSHHGAISKEQRTTKLPVLPEILEEKGYKTFAASSNAWISSFGGFEEMFQEFHFLGNSFELEDKLLFKNDEVFKEVYNIEQEEGWESKKTKYTYLLKESAKQLSPQTLINGAYYLLFEKQILQKEQGDDGAKEANKKLAKSFEDQEKPFFGFINYVEPHDPYTPPKEIAEDFLEDHSFEEAMKVSDEADLVQYLKEKPEDKAVLEDLYDAEIKYLDSQIQELVEKVEEKSDRKTIFIITSDHGENFSEKEGLWGHYGKITEDLVRVPLIIKSLGEDTISENFELRSLKKLIESIAEGEKTIETSEKAITEYWGLDSHTWDIKCEEFPDVCCQNQKFCIGNSWLFWAETQSEGDKNLKDFIEIRVGRP